MPSLEEFLHEYEEFITVFLMVSSLYIVVTRENMIKKIVGLGLFQTSVYLLYLFPAKLPGGTAPILLKGLSDVVYSNPLPHVLILTAIVVGIANLAVGLALVVRINEAFGTTEEEELFGKGKSE